MFLDLVYQVQKLLGLKNGGTGNSYGLAHGTIFRAQNGSGASIAVGSVVKRATYPYPVVTVTTVADETGILGVSVGTMPADEDTIDPGTATPNSGSVAVAIAGIASVRLGADVTAGQYAYSHATDGTAYGGGSLVGGAFGRFLTSGTAGGTAKVLIGQTATELATHATTHQPGGADPMAVDATAATGSLRTIGTGALQAAAGNHLHDGIVLMTDGITSPPEPLWNEAGDDWLYEG